MRAVGAARARRPNDANYRIRSGLTSSVAAARCSEPASGSAFRRGAALFAASLSKRSDPIIPDQEDVMAYCYPRWIDYNYEKLVRWVQLSQAW